MIPAINWTGEGGVLWWIVYGPMLLVVGFYAVAAVLLFCVCLPLSLILGPFMDDDGHTR